MEFDDVIEVFEKFWPSLLKKLKLMPMSLFECWMFFKSNAGVEVDVKVNFVYYCLNCDDDC